MQSNNIVGLRQMTRELCHELYKSWENDDSIYMDMSIFKEYVYNEESVDHYFDSKQGTSCRIFAIMLEDRPIGELQLKQIDMDKKLAIKYAFDELGMVAVNADTVVKNTRSQHILEKIGFQFLKEEGYFRYYRLEKS